MTIETPWLGRSLPVVHQPFACRSTVFPTAIRLFTATFLGVSCPVRIDRWRVTFDPRDRESDRPEGAVRPAVGQVRRGCCDRVIRMFCCLYVGGDSRRDQRCRAAVDLAPSG